ncbi:hypothetical protein EVAR_51979_1 [Eumeta japonica]|uniref:Uncharacterized protein n=1 Tax=Eumeta variegata TaxID=151549 RepID=A0A4C1Y4A4_EUMVA|nr:hypothetical protein EVAR_51979_1 [Eumeta japonica]
MGKLSVKYLLYADDQEILMPSACDFKDVVVLHIIVSAKGGRGSARTNRTPPPALANATRFPTAEPAARPTRPSRERLA